MLTNWTKATTTTTGTGTLTLSAVSGFPAPGVARAIGEWCSYSIQTSDGKLESGFGKMATSTTFTRDKVVSSFDGTTYNNTTATALTLASGTHNFYLTPMAENLVQPLLFPCSGMTNPSIVSSHLAGTNQANVGAAAAVLRATAFPFNLEVSGKMTGFGVYVSGTVTSGTLILALYDVLSNGNPGRRICQSSSTISTATSGYKTISSDVNVQLTAGWYYVAVNLPTGSTVPNLVGTSIALNVPFGASGIGGNYTGLRSDSDGSGTLADPFPTGSPVYNGGTPYIGLLIT